MTETIVEVNEGKLKGVVVKSVNGVDFHTFRGIPYAKPPVGDLRFAIPQSPEPWDGVRDATKRCNICAQFDTQTSSFIGDEDCLFLNVYTPQLPSDSTNRLPVMVFLHGGGFVHGHGTDDTIHGADYLVEKDVVVVSINYRLGILGFLSLDRKEAPGNMGLRDQVQALKWIQKNISNFNGDPGNVTIFGISAGASSVEYLLLSPLARGLFHKAIAQAGSSLLPWAMNKTIKELAFKIPLQKEKKITDEEELFKYLKDMPVKDLVELSTAAVTAEEYKGGIYFGFTPTIENPGDWEPFLAESPKVLLKRGDFAKVPYIGGFCSREGLLMLMFNPSSIEILCADKNFFNYLPFDIEDDKKTEFTNKMKKAYLENRNDDTCPDDFAIDFFTDVDFLGGMYYAIMNMSKKNSPVYVYEFSYDGGMNYLKKKLSLDRPGACHGDDGGYIIKTDTLIEGASDTDKLVRERMTTMWTNFAKLGDPTPKTNELFPIKWEPVAETGLVYLNITDTLQMKTNLLPERTKLFVELYDKYYK